jgi:hypothetical protein
VIAMLYDDGRITSRVLVGTARQPEQRRTRSDKDELRKQRTEMERQWHDYSLASRHTLMKTKASSANLKWHAIVWRLRIGTFFCDADVATSIVAESPIFLRAQAIRVCEVG